MPKKTIERKRWTDKEVALLKSTGTALAKKLHRSPASVGIKFYNLTSAGRARYFAKKSGKGKPKKHNKPVAKKAAVKKVVESKPTAAEPETKA